MLEELLMIFAAYIQWMVAKSCKSPIIHKPSTIRLVVQDFATIQSIISLAGWWFGAFFIFPYIGKNHPN
jgi:hypothetical protein